MKKALSRGSNIKLCIVCILLLTGAVRFSDIEAMCTRSKNIEQEWPKNGALGHSAGERCVRGGKTANVDELSGRIERTN